VPADSLRTFFGVLEGLRPAFTAASFPLLLTILTGWLCTTERHTLSEALVASGVSATRDHSCFYRFFSRGTWDPDALGKLVFAALLTVLDPNAPLSLVLDDTLAHHKGPHVFGLGTHLDAVRSTRRTKVFTFGHVWVVLAVVIPVPWSRRSFALPVLMRLYRNEKDAQRAGLEHKTRTALGREMLALVQRWCEELAPGRLVGLAIDSGYANGTVLGSELGPLTVVASMRPDAALGRGKAKSSPKERAEDPSWAWQWTDAWLYGRWCRVQYKTWVASWPHVLGDRSLRIVVVRCETGSLPLRVFFSTETAASARAVLEYYAGTRWPIECTFRDLKQYLGFSDPAVRTQHAVLRIAPLLGLTYSLLVLWSVRAELNVEKAVLPQRPWYRHKHHLSFPDVLRSARKMLETGDLLALDRDAHRNANAPLPHATPQRKRAA